MSIRVNKSYMDWKVSEKFGDSNFKFTQLPIDDNGFPSKESVVEFLRPYNITVVTYEKKKEKLYAWMESDHRINGIWWEDIVSEIFPGCYSITGSKNSFPPAGERECKFKLRLI